MKAKTAIKLAQVASGQPAYKTAACLGYTQAAYSSFCRGLAQVDRLAIIARALGFRLVLTNGSISYDILPDTSGQKVIKAKEAKERKE